MQPTSIYVVILTYADGVTINHNVCFSSELAARCDAEVLAEGKLDWLSRTYGIDDHKTEFEVQQLLLWRYSAERAA